MKKPTVYSFFPEEPIKVNISEKKRVQYFGNWTAPEHTKMATGMKRRHPVDDFGRRILGVGKELVIDKRPSILKPEAPKRLVF